MGRQLQGPRREGGDDGTGEGEVRGDGNDIGEGGAGREETKPKTTAVDKLRKQERRGRPLPVHRRGKRFSRWRTSAADEWRFFLDSNTDFLFRSLMSDGSSFR